HKANPRAPMGPQLTPTFKLAARRTGHIRTLARVLDWFRIERKRSQSAVDLVFHREMEAIEHVHNANHHRQFDDFGRTESCLQRFQYPLVDSSGLRGQLAGETHRESLLVGKYWALLEVRCCQNGVVGKSRSAAEVVKVGRAIIRTVVEA